MALEMQGRSSDGYAMDWLSLSLYHALAMLWATFWALVLGFTISGVLQVFVSKEQISRAFGQTNLKSVSLATGLGAASSSCSYAAVAAARSAIQQGAALIPALAFMFASTNLVIELGAVLWVLMGWQFVLAEIFGALVLIILMWLLIRLFLPKTLEAQIRQRAANQTHENGHCHHEHPPSPGSGAADEHEHELATASSSIGEHEERKWTRVAHAFVTDWSMLWKEILGGFLIAGFLATLVPHDWWEGLFLQTGPPVVRLIENALVGPIIAMISFVCSVGKHSTRQPAVVAWHQFRGCDFVYLRRPHRHSDHHHLRQILRSARRGLDYRNFLRLDGSCRNHRRSDFQRITLDSPGTASAERGGARAHYLELHQLARCRCRHFRGLALVFAF